jgi:hypothetical protein
LAPLIAPSMKWGYGVAHIPFPGCIDLMRHSRIRVYTHLHELRLIEVFAGLEWACSDILGTVLEENSYLKTNAL